MILEIYIYGHTFIDATIPIGITLITALIVYLVDYKNYKKTYNYGNIESFMYAMMHYIIGFGFIVSSLFILSNYYLADQNKKIETFNIIEVSEIPKGARIGSKEMPVFTIEYKGKIKDLVFFHEKYEKRNTYKEVTLEISKGFLGFEVIKSKELK
jgi:hypothetical protein